MIDERRIEVLLLFERGPDDPPDETAEPAFEGTVGGRRPGGRMFQARLIGVICCRRRPAAGPASRGPLERLVERRQRRAVQSIRVPPLVVESLEQLLERLLRVRPGIIRSHLSSVRVKLPTGSATCSFSGSFRASFESQRVTRVLGMDLPCSSESVGVTRHALNTPRGA